MALTPPCDRCGRDAQFDIAELWLCLDCYHVAGSTCAGVTRPTQPAAASTATSPTPAASAGSMVQDADAVC